MARRDRRGGGPGELQRDTRTSFEPSPFAEMDSALEDEPVSVLRALRRARVERAESEERFRCIADNIEEVFYQVGSGHNVLYVSPAYETVYGRPIADVYRESQRWLDAVHPQDAQVVEEARRNIRPGEPLDVEYRILWPDGAVRWVRDRAYVAAGKGAGTVGVVRDITDERKLQEELAHAHKMEAVGVLASSVAHDFGNLLHGIMGGTSMALSPDTPPERARVYQQHVLEACRRGSALVAQLMSFGHKRSLNPTPMSLDAFLDDSSELIDRLLGEHIEIEVEPGAPHAVLLADPVQIEQILLNLAANARAAMPTGGTLAISTHDVELPEGRGRPAGNYVRLIVRDSGVGMDNATMARIFDPFFTTKEIGNGTGLGLSTALDTVRGLGGFLEVHSEVGRGTAFVIDFPRLEGGTVRPERRSRPRIRFRGMALLIEDDGLVRITVRHYLEELGFVTIAVDNADDALEHAELHRDEINLVVCDVTLPGENGPSLIARMRERHGNGVPVLFITAHSPWDLVDQGIVDARAPLLGKPFERDALGAKLREILPPALRRRPSYAAIPIPEAAEPITGRHRSARLHVMIVEDNLGARLALGDHLTDLGYAVSAFGRPIDALDVAPTAPPIDVLLVDLGLPGMSGDELARRLRAMQPSLRVVYMSASRNLPAGLDGPCLKKPFDLDRVATAVRAALDAAAAAAASA
ncbi:MAG: hypothetical protein DRJ42_15380 [Deltaproteobacteria bacterium]|nr:MAG: hypothetical protein DRJ42_15380 [Deltaproteobacteria bacterium]